MTAFQNSDETIAVQVINNSGRPRGVNLAGLPLRGSRKVSTYLTDNGNDLTAGSLRCVKGQIRDSIPAHAMKSYVT